MNLNSVCTKLNSSCFPFISIFTLGFSFFVSGSTIHSSQKLECCPRLLVNRKCSSHPICHSVCVLNISCSYFSDFLTSYHVFCRMPSSLLTWYTYYLSGIPPVYFQHWYKNYCFTRSIRPMPFLFKHHSHYPYVNIITFFSVFKIYIL